MTGLNRVTLFEQGIFLGSGIYSGLFVIAFVIGIAGLLLYYKRSYNRSLLYKIVKIKPEYKKILEARFPYYQRLSDEDKKKFERRLQYFISTKQFIPRHFSYVTAEMKTLIAAAAVQLTFGFSNVNLSHFKRILIYPDTYYSTIRKKYHKGEVNPAARLIVFSWKNFMEGSLKNGAAVNLGLHEMAHALRLENNILNQEPSFFDPELLEQWEVKSIVAISNMEKNKDWFFRKYSSVNEDEFFAVAVENFFERPAEFKQKYTALYESLARLLKQDPLVLLSKTA